jgi:hypothetical protein
VFEYYDITLEGNDRVTLTYKLEQHRPAQVWAGLLLKQTPKDTRPKLNPWRHFNRDVMYGLIDELNILIDDINVWIPNTITSKWDMNDHQSSVNRLHIHFPEQEKNETDPVKRAQLTRYNDIIHELEGLLYNKNKLFPRLIICFDHREVVDLIDDDFKYFKAQRRFGELCMHYPHVGRHPFELFQAGDFDCPIDQIIPQSLISADHTLRFYDDELMDHHYKPKFKEFYDNSTLKDKLRFDDPKMAFGSISMGRLITKETKQDIFDKVKSCNKIVDWKIY